MAVQSAINQVLGVAAAKKKADDLTANKAVQAKANDTKQAILEQKLKTQTRKASIANIERKKAKLALERAQERAEVQREKRERTKQKIEKTHQTGVVNDGN